VLGYAGDGRPIEGARSGIRERWGSVDNAGANTIEVILGLVQNAFFKAILPGFEREVTGRSRRT
jgi:hypothetical protein